MDHKQKLLDWRAVNPEERNKFFGESMLQTRLGISLDDARRLIGEGLREKWIVSEPGQDRAPVYRLATDV